MSLQIAPVLEVLDPAGILITLINDAGDIIYLHCLSPDFRDSLLTKLLDTLGNFEIIYKKGD